MDKSRLTPITTDERKCQVPTGSSLAVWGTDVNMDIEILLSCIRPIHGAACCRMYDDGCTGYQASMGGLPAVEADLHRDIPKENNILSPKAAALEERMATA